MSVLTKLAQGKSCTIRLPGCDGGGETTVLAHYRILPFNGIGIKPPDWLGAWACFRCHELVDKRKPSDLDGEYLRLSHLEGVIRTLMALNAIGKVKL